MTLSIAQRLHDVQELISQYEKKYNRKSHSVSLLAVSKGQSADKISQAFASGQTAFGENYLQEALEKIKVLPNTITWHFLGNIQSNKTKKIAEHFTWVHSISDKHIAKRLNYQRPSTLLPLNICIEVNVSDDKNKSGIHPDNLLDLATYCKALPQLKLRGLMTIPAKEDKQAFHHLFLLQQKLNSLGFTCDTLSMGMSDDFETAIAEGSTLVRIGTAIFGQRT